MSDYALRLKRDVADMLAKDNSDDMWYAEFDIPNDIRDAARKFEVERLKRCIN